MIELIAVSFLLAADIPEPQPKIDCAKVRWFVNTYSEGQAMSLARKWGYSEETIRKARKCLSPERS